MNTKYAVLRDGIVYFNSNIYNITTTSARVFTNYYIMFSSDEKEYPKLFMNASFRIYKTRSTNITIIGNTTIGIERVHKVSLGTGLI